jgi:hypothetical protein
MSVTVNDVTGIAGVLVGAAGFGYGVRAGRRERATARSAELAQQREQGRKERLDSLRELLQEASRYLAGDRAPRDIAAQQRTIALLLSLPNEDLTITRCWMDGGHDLFPADKAEVFRRCKEQGKTVGELVTVPAVLREIGAAIQLAMSELENSAGKLA